MKKKQKYSKEIQAFKKNGGVLNAAKAINYGVHPRNLYAMAKEGVIAPVTRGVYKLTSSPEFSNPDFAIVGLKIPHGVICLISALSFHEITTQIPHAVDVALKIGTRKPKLEFPPVDFVWLSEPGFNSGVEIKEVDGIPIRVYNIEKTVADCFKFRNKVGLDVAIEALKFYREKKQFDADTLLKYARICRIEKMMSPYIQALL
jgi:predicted transcriptional regulator of viral defense system